MIHFISSHHWTILALIGIFAFVLLALMIKSGMLNRMRGIKVDDTPFEWEELNFSQDFIKAMQKKAFDDRPVETAIEPRKFFKDNISEIVKELNETNRRDVLFDTARDLGELDPLVDDLVSQNPNILLERIVAVGGTDLRSTWSAIKYLIEKCPDVLLKVIENFKDSLPSRIPDKIRGHTSKGILDTDQKRKQVWEEIKNAIDKPSPPDGMATNLRFVENNQQNPTISK